MNIAKWQLIGLLLLTALTTHFVPKLVVVESSREACRSERRVGGPLLPGFKGIKSSGNWNKLVDMSSNQGSK